MYPVVNIAKEDHPRWKNSIQSPFENQSMFRKLEYWRRIAMRYGKCVEFGLSAIALAVKVLFWL
jgi:hypothetical protein